jgi:hypothetical protein
MNPAIVQVRKVNLLARVIMSPLYCNRTPTNHLRRDRLLPPEKAMKAAAKAGRVLGLREEISGQASAGAAGDPRFADFRVRKIGLAGN